LYTSTSIVRVIKARRTRWAGNVAQMRETRYAFSIFLGKPERKNHLEDLGVDVKIILEWILGKLGGRVWTGFIWLRIGISGGLL